MERTDIHRPSAIVPEDYQFVVFDYIGSSDLGAIMMLKVEKERLWAHMNQTGGKFANHEHGGTCFVCGALAMYLCVFYHAKSNSYIKTGEDCARKLDMSYGDMNYFRRVIGDAREAQAGKKKAIALLADAGLARAWELYETDYNVIPSKYEEMTIRDIVGKLVKYGSISDAQTSFVRRLLDNIDHRPIVEAQRKAEYDAALPCPSGRLRIQGVVLGLKEVNNPYSWSKWDKTKTNILVQSKDGFKVYGPRFNSVNKSDAVDFVATIQPSDKDAKFGFFKRPVPYVDKQLAKFLATVAWG